MKRLLNSWWSKTACEKISFYSCTKKEIIEELFFKSWSKWRLFKSSLSVLRITMYVCLFKKPQWSEVTSSVTVKRLPGVVRNTQFSIFDFLYTYRSPWQCSVKCLNSSSDQVRSSSRLGKDTFIWKIPFLAKFFNIVRLNGTNCLLVQLKLQTLISLHVTKSKGWFCVLIFSMNPS